MTEMSGLVEESMDEIKTNKVRSFSKKKKRYKISGTNYKRK